jgi:hypothetical protein
MSEELIIDETNFDQYFFDVRKHSPKLGQVMAVYTAEAELVDGDLKRDIVYLLSCTSKYKQCVAMLKKMCWAEESDAVRLCREIAQDLHSGMTAKEIGAKPYTYKFRAFYYTEKENVPSDNPHWSFMEIKNLGEHIEKIEHLPGGTIKSKVVS